MDRILFHFIMERVFFQTSLKESFPTCYMTIRTIIHVSNLKTL